LVADRWLGRWWTRGQLLAGGWLVVGGWPLAGWSRGSLVGGWPVAGWLGGWLVGDWPVAWWPGVGRKFAYTGCDQRVLDVGCR
jgi:hypothetical protein